MSSITLQTMDLIQMLPNEELIIVNSLLKHLVFSWDTDYIKVTFSEKDKLERIEKALEQ